MGGRLRTGDGGIWRKAEEEDGRRRRRSKKQSLSRTTSALQTETNSGLGFIHLLVTACAFSATVHEPSLNFGLSAKTQTMRFFHCRRRRSQWPMRPPTSNAVTTPLPLANSFTSATLSVKTLRSRRCSHTDRQTTLSWERNHADHLTAYPPNKAVTGATNLHTRNRRHK